MLISLAAFVIGDCFRIGLRSAAFEAARHAAQLCPRCDGNFAGLAFAARDVREHFLRCRGATAALRTPK